MAAAAKELPACPVETTLTLISNKWKVLILRDLMPGTKRFGELKKSIGSVSQKVLTAQLREMERSGLLTRTVYPEVPPRVEYTLTDLGYSLKPILDAMRNWGEAYKAQKQGEPSLSVKPPALAAFAGRSRKSPDPAKNRLLMQSVFWILPSRSGRARKGAGSLKGETTPLPESGAGSSGSNTGWRQMRSARQRRRRSHTCPPE